MVKKQESSWKNALKASILRLKTGAINEDEFEKDFLDNLFFEFSKSISEIREESETYFLKGILIGAMFGIVGNIVVTSLFKMISTDLNPFSYGIITLVSIACLGYMIYYTSRRLDRNIKK